MAVARELASIDAPMAKSLLEFGQPEQESWTPAEITDPQNPGNVMSVLHNGRGRFVYPDGTPVFDGGLLGPQQAQADAPSFGILSQAVEQVESGGNPNAVSPKGAIGPMQTMPGTLMDPGFGVTPARDNSIEEQRRVGQDYLKALTEKFGITGGLAAYNWGPGNWDRALASNGNDISAALQAAPAETRNYVPKVLDRAGAQSATPQGSASRFSRPRYKPEDTKTAQPTDLERRIDLARKMGANEAEIKRLVLGDAAPSARDALGGKALPMNAVNGLAKEADKLANLQGIMGGFKDAYAGYKVGGDAVNLAGRLTGSDQAQWWQGYDRMKNEVRNELFGASLTIGEQRAFEAADITPNMDPKTVKANLGKQAKLIEVALRRKARTWAAQGYNRDAIQEVTGIQLDHAEAAPAGT